MHTYIRSIGFSKKDSQVDIEALVKDVVVQADSVKTIIKDNGNIYVEYQKSFGENIGITVRGEEDEKGIFHIGTFFP